MKVSFNKVRVSKRKLLGFSSLLVVVFVFSSFAKAATSAIDTFTDTAGKQLQDHTSDTGDTWTKNTVASGSVVITDSNRARGNSSSPAIYYSSWVPTSSDYEVSTDIYIAGSGLDQTGLGVRSGTTAFTGYYALLTTQGLTLFRGGKGTPLGSYALSVSTGTTHSLKLSAEGNYITVKWDDQSVITVTASGADIISSAGYASIYSQGNFTNSTGPHLDNFRAENLSTGQFTAGVLSEVSHGDTSTVVSWTASSGGISPRSDQLQRSAHGANSWSNVSGATSSPVTDSGLNTLTSYDYRVAFTDATPSTVYSNVVTVTTSEECSPPSAYRCAVQTEPGIRYYWPMDEASGATTLAPLVGNVAINLTGATTGVAGKIDGTATLFNGSSDFGATASNLSLGGLQKVVVEALIKSDTYGTGIKAGWEYGPSISTTPGGFFYGLNETAVTPNKLNVLLRGSNGYNYALYNQPSTGQWHHIAAVYNMGASTNEVDLYIDGSLQSAYSRPVTTNNTDTFVNNIFYVMSRAGTQYFGQGSMQHLAIYDNLSSERIAAHSQVAAGSTLAPGTISESSHTNSTATVSWTSATDGASPVTDQLQRSAHGANSWSNVSGATSSPATDTGLSASTTYDYRVRYTDNDSNVVYSNIISVTTDGLPLTTYTVQQSNLWDNGYDNVSAPRQSNFARLVFTTDADSITVTGTTTIYGSYSSYAHLGVRVDGVNASPLIFTGNGSQSFTVPLGSSGTTRTVEITTGLQSMPASTVLGTFIDSITYPNSATFAIQTPTTSNRILVYGDSIAAGGNSTNAEYNAYIPLLRNTFGYSVMAEAYGYRSLYVDANTTGLRNAFVSRLAGYNPSTIVMAIGTNDYGLNKWNASSFGTAYAAVLDGLHSALPSARIICQTPLVRSSEAANGNGNTLSDYRAQITTACNDRSWTTLVNGTSLLTTSDLDDGVHPSTAGHTKYAKRLAPLLANPAISISGPSSGIVNTASSTFTATMAGSVKFMGDQTVTISAANGSFTATAASGSVSGNGTSTVVVTPANNASSFTFTYTPNSTGSKTLQITNAQSWIDPSAVSYSVTSANTSPSTPSLLGPAGYVDGSYGNDRTPTLEFTLADSDVSDELGYRIQVDNNADFGSPVIDYTSPQDSQGQRTFTVGQAAGSGTYNTGSATTTLDDASYYWRVKAIDDASAESSYATANSSSTAFIVDGTAPSTPGTPSTTSPSADTTPTWSWTASTDGGSGLANPAYSAQWSQDNTFNTGVTSSASNSASFAQPSTLADGTWYFRVRSLDTAGNYSSYSNNGTVIIDSANPIISNIEISNIGDTTATITWSTNENTDSYVEYGTSTSYGTNSSPSNDHTSHSINLSGLTPATTYHYRVISTDAVGNQAISSDQTFQTDNAPEPSLDSDSDGIPDSTEDAAPNNGDGNFDGFPDGEQAFVASFQSELTDKYITLAVSEDCEIIAIGLDSPSTSDNAFQYPNGLLDFTAECPESGYTTSVDLFYHNVDKSDLVIRKYNPNTQVYSTITSATLSEDNIDGNHVTIASYDVTDGEELDTDGLPDGVITDPVGLGESTQSEDSNQNQGNVPGGLLVKTGASALTPIFVSLFLVSSGTALTLYRRK